MDFSQIKEILKQFKNGDITMEETLRVIKDLPFESVGTSHIDHHRELRQGIPEVVFAEGKSTEEVVEIATAILNRTGKVLVTRANDEIYNALKNTRSIKYFPHSGVIATVNNNAGVGNVLVITAGTSDIPVAEEAGVTAEFLGSRVETVYDVGVAGIHRLLAYKDRIEKANVLIVVAGMEGALPSVVGGLTDRIIIAVPTSRGYGTSFGGLTALFSMLNSCVPGIAVMNIDNGFGAGCLAHKINKAIVEKGP
ncbi:MAG: nickel pincer cofactor biosynthesis protein LarB [Nitrospirae bacterium]|nr:nickel pincer cofactor biosynthesis protein LarB [Nitrospirota bacterium]